MKAPTASLIVATYRREAALRETLACIEQLAVAGLEVLVVDQTLDHERETDALLSAMARRQVIRHVRLSEPGLSRARNVGLALTRGPIVIFIDDDVAFAPDFVDAHLAAFDAPEVGGSAGRVHLRARIEGEPLPPSEPPATSDEWFDQLAPLAAVGIARGCNMAFRREALLRAGGFDTRYLTSTEDEDICFGIRSLGGRIVFTPRAWLIHRLDPGGTRTQPGEIQGRAEFFHDRFYFMLKNTSTTGATRTLARTYLNSIANRRVLAMGATELLRRHRAMFQGAIWGWQSWRAGGAVRRRLSHHV